MGSFHHRQDRCLPDSRNDITIYGSHGRLKGLGTLWEKRQGALGVRRRALVLSQARSSEMFCTLVHECDLATTKDRIKIIPEQVA